MEIQYLVDNAIDVRAKLSLSFRVAEPDGCVMHIFCTAD